MGHKVNPVSFRIPYLQSWKSSWFADKKQYKHNLGLDLKVRDVVKSKLTGIPLGDIIVKIDSDSIVVDIYTSKTSLVTGKTGEVTDDLVKTIERKSGRKTSVNVKEVKNPDANAKLVAFTIVNAIEKRLPYKRAIKQAMSKSMEKGVKGIKVKISGRLNGTDIARNETFKEGAIPTLTIRSDIDYCSSRAETVYGSLGIKVWIYKGAIMKK